MHNFRVNLISGENLILVEKKGYDSEIFVPQILNGRITLLNVNKVRRCCQLDESIGAVKILPEIKISRVSTGSIPIVRSEKACDEVFKIPSPFIPKLSNSNNDLINQRLSLELASHELLRLKPALQNSNLPTNVTGLPMVDDLPLFNSVDNLTSGPTIISNTLIRSAPKTIENNSRKFAVMGNMCGLTSTPKTNSKLVLQLNNSQQSNTEINETVTKWRNCLTPVRTYSKYQRICPTNLNNSNTSSPRMIPLEKTALPHYLRNPTKGRQGEYTVEIKRSKLIIDNKIKIKASEYKKQHKVYSNLTVNNNYFQLPKTKKEMHYLECSKYDYFTNPSCKYKLMAKSLTDMYKKRCIRKHQKTILNFETLGNINQFIAKRRINLDRTKLIPKKLII